jgi:hypothetical protein
MIHILKQPRKLALVFIFSAALIATAALILQHHCPTSGFAFSPFSKARRELHRLKNRTAIPQPTDFDTTVTLEKMLQPGDDHNRWSATRAARVEGYVVSIANGPLELSNCYLPCSRDIHIHIGLRPDAPPREQVVLEITPRMQEWARHEGGNSSRLQVEDWSGYKVRDLSRQLGRDWPGDWSEETLRRELPGHWCSFEGWLLFDSHHAAESENTTPGRANNWRATAWEIHPITNLVIRASNKVQ